VKADVSITASISDRGVNKLGVLTQLVESVMLVEHCDISSTQVQFKGSTNRTLSELTAALYSNPDAAKLLHNITYSVVDVGGYIATGGMQGVFTRETRT